MARVAPMRKGALLLVALGFLMAGVSTAAGQSTEPPQSCPVPNAAGTASRAVIEPPIALQADAQSEAKVVNLGSDREAESPSFRVNAPSALPVGLEKHLALVADPIVRTGETIESASVPDPTFSVLRISGNRKQISFRVCLDPPSDLPAGKYTGLIALEGPPGVDSAAMTLTINAKDGRAFWAAAIITAFVAFLVLLYKGAGDERVARIAAAEKLPDKLPDGSDNQDKARAKAAAGGWRSAGCACLKNPTWMVPTAFALGGAFGVLLAAYSANPSWGEAGFLSSAATLVGTGLAAVGAKAIFTSSAR